MDKDYFRILNQKTDSIQKGLDRLERDMADDRSWLHEFVLRLSSVESYLNELLKSQKGQANRIADKVEDKVSEAVQPVIEETQNLQETIQEKKVINFSKPDRDWFGFLKRH